MLKFAVIAILLILAMPLFRRMQKKSEDAGAKKPEGDDDKP